MFNRFLFEEQIYTVRSPFVTIGSLFYGFSFLIAKRVPYSWLSRSRGCKETVDEDGVKVESGGRSHSVLHVFYGYLGCSSC